jgi:hypothetical protein
MLYVLLAAVIVWGLPTIYLAYRFRAYRKFLAGAFFVSWGIQLYLYSAKVSVPLLGTDLVFTPEISGARCIPHFILFLLCLYFGFFSKPRESPLSAGFDPRSLTGERPGTGSQRGQQISKRG